MAWPGHAAVLVPILVARETLTPGLARSQSHGSQDRASPTQTNKTRGRGAWFSFVNLGSYHKKKGDWRLTRQKSQLMVQMRTRRLSFKFIGAFICDHIENISGTPSGPAVGFSIVLGIHLTQAYPLALPGPQHFLSNAFPPNISLP